MPVLALTRRSGSVRSPWAPKSMTRLASLLVISSMMKATFSGTTRRALASGLSVKIVLPLRAVDDVVDRARVVVHAEVGDGGGAVSELERGDAVRQRAEGGRVARRAGPVGGVVERGEPGGDLQVGDVRDAGRHLDLDRGDVERVAEARLHHARAVPAAVVVERRVRGLARARREVHRGVEDRRRHGEEVRGDRRGVGEQLDRRPRAARGQRHVGLAHVGVVVVPRAHQRQHLARLGIEVDDGAVLGVVRRRGSRRCRCAAPVRRPPA